MITILKICIILYFFFDLQMTSKHVIMIMVRIMRLKHVKGASEEIEKEIATAVSEEKKEEPKADEMREALSSDEDSF